MVRACLATAIAASVGCQSLPAVVPTAPTAAAAPVAAFLQLDAGGPDYLTGRASIGVTARDAGGVRIDAPVSCQAVAGELVPSTFRTLGAGTAVLTLSGTTAPTAVRCSSGDVSRSVDVDLSAWAVDLRFHDHVGADSRVLVMPIARIRGVPVTRLTIAWGDGTTEASPFLPLGEPWDPVHRYATTGIYQTTVRIEWADGAAAVVRSLAGGPVR